MEITDKAERERIVKLYQAGFTVADTASETHHANKTVRQVLVEEGVFDKNRKWPKKQEKPEPRKPEFYYADQRLKQAIRTSDVLDIKNGIKIGDRLVIRTAKAYSEVGDDIEVGGRSCFGAVREVTVVDTQHPRFCIVEIRNGVKESILWSDIVMARKKGHVCVS